MSKTRIFDDTDYLFRDVIWNRTGITDAEKNRTSAYAMDVDNLGACYWCKKTLFLIEASRSNKAALGHHTLEPLARLTYDYGIPTYFAWYGGDDESEFTVDIYELHWHPEGFAAPDLIAEDLTAREYNLWDINLRQRLHQCDQKPAWLAR